MKKTLVALAVATLATSASALTIYNQDGTKVDFDGSLRLRLDNHTTKSGDTKTNGHTNLHNDGSRFSVKVKQDLADDLFALGRLEFRFNGGDRAKSTDQFGDLYAHRAFVGLGSKQFGEVTFGRQATIGGDIAQSGFANAYDDFDTTLTDVGKAVIRYDYKGIEGLQVGVDYRFAEDRVVKDDTSAQDAVDKAYLALLQAKDKYAEDASETNKNAVTSAQNAYDKAKTNASSVVGTNEVPVGKLKSGYGVGATYTFKPVEGQSVTVAAGYTRDNYVTGKKAKHHKDAYAAGVSYTVADLTLAADYAGKFVKNASKTSRFNGFRVGASYDVTSAVAVYGTYGHGVGKDKTSGVTSKKDVYDGFSLGTQYKVHKNVFTYLEGAVLKTKTTEGTKVTKSTDKNVGVGLRVHW